MIRVLLIAIVTGLRHRLDKRRDASLRRARRRERRHHVRRRSRVVARYVPADGSTPLTAATPLRLAAIAQENLDRAYRQVQYAKLEDEADHLGRLALKEADLGYSPPQDDD